MTASTLQLFTTALLAAVVLPVQEPFKASDYESLGKKIASFFEARRKSEGTDKVQEEISKELEKIQKRVKRDPLSLPGEMGKAVWNSFEYSRKTGIAKGKVDGQTEPAYWDAKTKLNWAVWVPSKYDARKAYPLIVCVPDQGEKPSDHLTERWTDAQIRENAVLVAIPPPADASVWLEQASETRETGMGNLRFGLARAMRTYAVDFDRVYVAGHGRGVELALAYAANFGDRFAGVIGRSGDVGPVVAENLRNLPTYFAGAGAKAGELAEKLKALGYDNATLAPDGKEADIWAWIQDHPRVASPTEVVLHVGTPAPNRAYWIEVRPTDGQGTLVLVAKVDRGTNTITVEGEGVPKFTIYFNDDLVDLDKPVKVVCNGTVNERTVPRSLTRMLDLIGTSRSDPGKVYVASMEFDLPPKPKPKDGK